MVGSRKKPVDSFAYRPAKQFEKANRLTGLSHSYVIKTGVLAGPRKPAQDWLTAQRRSADQSGQHEAMALLSVRQELDYLIRDNALALETIPYDPDEFRSVCEFASGILADLNPADISYSLARDKACGGSPQELQQQLELDQILMARMRATDYLLRKRNNGIFQPPDKNWRFSPQTMDSIERQANTPLPLARPSPRSSPKLG